MEAGMFQPLRCAVRTHGDPKRRLPARAADVKPSLQSYHGYTITGGPGDLNNPMAANGNGAGIYIDSGDTAWMITSCALVLMMTVPGASRPALRRDLWGSRSSRAARRDALCLGWRPGALPRGVRSPARWGNRRRGT